MKKIKSVRLKVVPEVELYKEEDEFGKVFYKSILQTVILSEERLNDFADSLEIEYEPERKYIDVRIEFENGIKLYGNDFSAKGLESYLTNSYTNSNTNKGQVKVTELPELFTRRDICEIFRGCFATQDYILTLINNFLERRNK